jgi:hypothetical protein
LDWNGVDGPKRGEFAEFHKVLSKELVEGVAGDPGLVSEFALSFDGYEAVGKAELFRIARKVEAEFDATGRIRANLVELRCCLFAAQRGFHHRGETMAGPYVDALMAAIRRNVTGGGTPVLDGDAMLRELATAAGYPSLLHLLASHTVFLHPETVRQTGGRAVFPVVRGPRRGERGQVEGVDVVFDDNTTPTYAFLWAADRTRGQDVQYNHVWDNQGRNPDTYTALWNLCVTPASLAKLTDGSAHSETFNLLRCRSFELFGYQPAGLDPPVPNADYESVRPFWAPTPEPVNLELALRRQLATKPRSKAAMAAREIGWLFSDGPDDTIPNGEPKVST